MSSRTELFEVLARGEFDRIGGTPESEWLDFKEKPHDLISRRGQRGLIADLAMFANHIGGVLVCGVQTTQSLETNREEASAVVGVVRSAVDETRLLAHVRAHIHPLLHVELRWYRGSSDPSKEILAIVVEPQPPESKPFVVDRVADAGDDRDIAHAVGWPIRHGSDTYWVSADRIQQLIAAGMRGGAIPPRSEPTDTSQDASPHDELSEQLGVLETEEWDRWATYVVQAYPRGPVRQLPDFYGEVLKGATTWRGVRQSGFSLGLNYGTLEARGSGRLVYADERRIVIIGRSGVVTAAAAGSPDMLGWANHQRTSWDALEFVEINPYVLVEFTYELIRFAMEFVGPRLAEPVGWRAQALGRHVGGGDGRKPLYLRPKPRRLDPFAEVRPPLGDSFRVTVDAADDAAETARMVLTEVYGDGWGVAATEIPFIEDDRVEPRLMDKE